MTIATGPFSVVRVTAEQDSDSLTYDTVRWGYEEYEEAKAELHELADAEGIPLEDLAIIRTWFAHDLISLGELEPQDA